MITKPSSDPTVLQHCSTCESGHIPSDLSAPEKQEFCPTQSYMYTNALGMRWCSCVTVSDNVPTTGWLGQDATWKGLVECHYGVKCSCRGCENPTIVGLRQESFQQGSVGCHYGLWGASLIKGTTSQYSCQDTRLAASMCGNKNKRDQGVIANHQLLG